MGYWGNVTSTIDWCETNYEHSVYIAEYWNSYSSLVLFLAGLINFASCLQEGYELRFLLYSIAVMIVGLGSFAFHATLLFEYQLLDELPMMYASSIWWFIWFEYEYPEVNRKWLCPALIVWTIFLTIVHSIMGFVLTFQVCFISMLVVGIYHVVSFMKREECCSWSVRFIYIYIGFFLVACACWVADRLLCEAFIGSINPQLHAWWHVLASVSCWVSIPLAVLARRRVLKLHADIHLHNFILPFVSIQHKPNSKGM
eukprot:m.337072 g.337072  ORF g.337072 m.337072 type:complete len:256 (-) comp18039_c0_seq1:1390-2157(-)